MTGYSRSTDEQLLQQAREGNMQAFRHLVERYEGAVAGTVIGMLGRGPDAEDVGQETFVRFYRALHRFRGDSSLKTYLTRIAMNQSLVVLKKRKTWRQRFVLRTDAMAEPMVDGAAVIDQQEHVRLVHWALDRLSPHHRAVVVLRMLEGYSTRDAAAVLGIPQGTVMSRLSRAMTSLKDILTPLIDDKPHGAA